MFKRHEKAVYAGAGVLVALAAVFTVTHIAIAQQPPPDATYKGMTICLACHKATHPEIVEAFQKTSHPKALLSPDEPNAVVATLDEDAPFKADQVKWILGVGKRQQAFIGADMKTLPGLWNVKDKKWQPLEVVDASTQCIGCHVTDFHEDNVTWVAKGVTCESCHGPGSVHATTAAKDKIGQISAFSAERQSMVCGRCHSRATSKDGKHKWAVDFKFGDDLMTYVTLEEVKGPRTWQQYNEWLGSTHAKSDVGCTTCHEVHGKASSNVAQLKQPEKELCMGCHADAVAKPEHPKLTDAMQCKLCHMPQGMHTFKALGK